MYTWKEGSKMKQFFDNKYLFILILLSFSVSNAQIDPCQDSLYLYLKSVPLDILTQRQYEYFMQKDKYCLEHFSTSPQLRVKSEQCTLNVIAETYHFEDSQDQFNPEIFIDDNRLGSSPQTIIIEPGQHTISLIPSKQINFEEGKVLKSRDRISQLYSMVAKYVFKANTSYKINFVFVCNKDDNNKCDKNEWFYKINIQEMKK